MRGPHDASKLDTRARRAAAAVKRRRYPLGKALARIRYFETQRGLALTGHRGRRMVSTSPAGSRGNRSTDSVGGRYLSASRSKARLQPTFPATANLPVWRPLGPNRIPHGQTYGTGGNNRPPVSGRCSGIVVNPSDRRRLVLCSAGGGLWGSQDAGKTWHPLTDDQPVLAMGALALAPGSPNILYAGTGDGDGQVPLGVGLLRSSDGGGTWTHLPASELSGIGIYDIAVNPADPLNVWVGSDNGCFESRNGGTTWRVVRRGTCWDIAIHPSAPAEILLATDKGLMRSTNGGGAWKTVPLPGVTGGAMFARLEACHAPSAPRIVYVAGVLSDDEKGTPLLWRRSGMDGGFAAQAVPSRMDTSQAWYDWCLAVAPDDPDRLFWGAIELYRGKRGATGAWTWENISSRASGDSVHGDQHFLGFDPSDARTLYACNDGGIFRSPDSGTHWEPLNPGLTITEFEFLVQLESEDTWLIGGTQDNGTLSLDADPLWEQVALGDGGDCGTADGTKPLCYHSYYGMWIERAPAMGPGAFRWRDVTPPRLQDEDVAAAYQALFYPPMDVVGTTLAKAGKTVFVSADSGGHWDEIDLPTSSDAEPDVASALVILDARTLFVGTAGGALYRISRGAAGWSSATVRTISSPRRTFISDIVPLGSGGQILWTSYSSLTGRHIFRSTDGGRSWSDRTGNLPVIPVNAIVVDPKDPKRVYAATDHGVYFTKNAGTHWSDFSNGLPSMIVGDMILHERRRILRIGTRSRGAWEVGI